MNDTTQTPNLFTSTIPVPVFRVELVRERTFDAPIVTTYTSLAERGLL